jgi:predicted aldo/keto reductase-like oxidoreductase
MKKKREGCSRRDFFKAAGTAGAAILTAPVAASAKNLDFKMDRLLAAGQVRVPTRPFGKSGIDVSILSLGGMFDIAANQLMLRQAIRWGVTYWDTADCYQRGSEAGIGKYFAKFPQDREKVFLVSKSDARDPDGMSQLLDRSLKRMNTSTIDLYFVHGVRDIDELNDATRRWAQKAKAEKKIRLFGFSTHRNMATLLSQASGLGYIDGIMMTYNFRNMHTPEMTAAVASCVKAGIGLTAMKTQAERSWMSLKTADKAGTELMESFLDQGITEHQAKLKAVWSNAGIASICSQMPSMTILKANVAAAADPTPLSSRQMHLFRQIARNTADQYCAGCSHICENAVAGAQVPIADIMRYHMYCQSYGHMDWARSHFKQIPADVRQQLARADFSTAERRCPQRMPIARLMRRALDDFA